MSRKTDPVLAAVLRADLVALQNALDEGCDPNLPDRAGRTPLANAVIGGESSIVDLLLRFKVNVNAPDTHGYTPLHHAAQRHLVAIVGALIAAGAEIDAKDSFGNTPLFRAVFESRGRGEVLDALMRAGADQHAKNNSGVSPRELAASIANFDVSSLLPDT
jgi:ankyrin repeat protein